MSGLKPSTRDRMLMKAREELTPDKSLAAIDAAAARVVGAVTVAATLISALGLLSATELADVGWGWALPSVLLAALAAALAVWATTPVFDTIAPGDLEALDRFFTRQLKTRGLIVRAASICLALALIATALPALAAAKQSRKASWDLTVARKSKTFVLHLEGQHLPTDGRVDAVAVGATGRPQLGLIEAQVGADHKVVGEATVCAWRLRRFGRIELRLMQPHHAEQIRSVPVPTAPRKSSRRKTDAVGPTRR